MIDFNLSVRLRIGNEDYDDESRPSFLSRRIEGIRNIFGSIRDFVDFLKNDDPINYRYTFEEGHDAYMILYDRNYPEGFYHNANNKAESFYKSHDINGNSIASFVVPEVYIQNSIQRMEGIQMTPTDILQSTSVAEIYLTNCDESNIDPYIPLRMSFDQHGVGTTWYGRRSKFEAIPGYFEEQKKSFEVEYEGIEEWLKNYVEEEPDLIDIMAIQRVNEMTNATQRSQTRKARRVQHNRN